MRAWNLTGRVVAIVMLTTLTLAACTQETTPNTEAANTEIAPTEPASVSPVIDTLAEGSSVTARASAAPLAESAETERSQAAEPSDVKALERVEFEEFDAARFLAPVSAEVPEVWIGWYVNRSIDAFRVAIDRSVPLVLVIGETSCKYCTNLIYNSLRCSAVDRFAGDAVFAFSSPASDRAAMAIASSLKIETYPTTTVLEPEARMLLERGRINGYFESSKMGEHLETILWKSAPRVYSDEYDDPEDTARRRTLPPARFASELGASIGATNRGLKLAPPTPQCK